MSNLLRLDQHHSLYECGVTRRSTRIPTKIGANPESRDLLRTIGGNGILCMSVGGIDDGQTCLVGLRVRTTAGCDRLINSQTL
jgi:hypothetical protein